MQPTKKRPPMIPICSGKFSKQAHVDLPRDTFEEEHGRHGFFGRVSHLYRTNTPTNWSRIDGPLKPRAYDLNKVFTAAQAERQPFLSNNDVRLSMYAPQQTMPYFFRNGDADEVWFIHQGAGCIETDYGPLSYQRGDYIVLPRGTTYRLYPNTSAPQFYVLIESFSEVDIPDRGQLGRNAFFDPGVLEYPQAQPSTAKATHSEATSQTGEWLVKIQREDALTDVYYPFNPLDVEGWKGDLFPWRLNVKDIRPIISPRFHLPPSVHTTLVGSGFVICTFAPRPTETGDDKAQRVPFFHRNIDYDEVIFYHDGDFFSRTNIKPGMVTFHPQGIHHGPHPKALQNQFNKDFADEVAVMVDTERPLKPCGLANLSEVSDYCNSWRC